MSGLAIITKALAAAGGGPLRVRDIDAGMLSDPGRAMERAKRLGLVRHAGNRHLWELTELGRDWCTGRVKLVDGGYRGPYRFVRTIATIGDGWIERLLLEAGHVPGTAVTPGVMREYSRALVKLARETA